MFEGYMCTSPHTMSCIFLQHVVWSVHWCPDSSGRPEHIHTVLDEHGLAAGSYREASSGHPQRCPTGHHYPAERHRPHSGKGQEQNVQEGVVSLARSTLSGGLASETLSGGLARSTLSGGLASETLSGGLASETLSGGLASEAKEGVCL